MARELLAPTSKAGGIYEIKNGIAFSDYGYVFVNTDTGLRLVKELSTPLCDLSFEAHYFHGKYEWRYFNRIAKLNASLAVINSTAASHNYYHWLIEAFPRIGLLEQAGICPDFYFASYSTGYQRNTLERLALPVAKIIPPGINTGVMASRLLVPSLTFKSVPNSRHGEDYLGGLYPFGSEWLRAKFLAPKQEEGALPRGKKGLYVSRNGMPERSVANEGELLEFLRPRGFEAHRLDGMTIAEQADLFSQASIVIAPHGAALANIVFCDPGTTIIDLMPARRIRGFYKALSTNGKLDYHMLVLPSIDSKDNLFVPVKQLSAVLDRS